MTVLNLGRNKISDPGMIAFSDAIRNGSLAKLEKLFLHKNNIGDDGMKAFAEAVRSGSLPECDGFLCMGIREMQHH